MLKRICLALLIVAMAGAIGCASKKPGQYVISGPRPGTSTSQRPITLPSAALKPPAAKTTTVLPSATMSSAVLTPTNRVGAPPVQVRAPGIAPAATLKPSTSSDVGSTKMASAYSLKPGDFIYVYLRGIPQEQQIEDQIDELGYITLPYINEVMAAGLTASDLERSIRSTYIDQQIYKNISVNVVLPSKFYYVRGEVKQPGRYPITANVTILQAIASAGGYTEFANSRKVQLLRGDKSQFISANDLERHPEKDVAVESGDVIVVHRSVF